MVTTTTEKILNVLGCEEFQVSLSFVDDAAIAELNERYRGKSGPTDVLSFPQLSKNEIDSVASFVRDRRSIEAPLLGDVVIAPGVAARNADEQKKPLEEEIVFLIIHSLLHLLGYDHEQAADAKRMRTKEREVLAALKNLAGAGD